MAKKITPPAKAAAKQLSDLIVRIRNEHAAVYCSARQTLQHALILGDLLIEAKDLVGHGNWSGWPEKHCSISDRTAQGCMRLASNREAIEAEAQIRNVSDLTIRGALTFLAKSRSSTPDDNDAEEEKERRKKYAAANEKPAVPDGLRRASGAERSPELPRDPAMLRRADGDSVGSGEPADLSAPANEPGPPALALVEAPTMLIEVIEPVEETEAPTALVGVIETPVAPIGVSAVQIETPVVQIEASAVSIKTPLPLDWSAGDALAALLSFQRFSLKDLGDATPDPLDVLDLAKNLEDITTELKRAKSRTAKAPAEQAPTAPPPVQQAALVQAINKVAKAEEGWWLEQAECLVDGEITWMRLEDDNASSGGKMLWWPVDLLELAAGFGLDVEATAAKPTIKAKRKEPSKAAPDSVVERAANPTSETGTAPPIMSAPTAPESTEPPPIEPAQEECDRGAPKIETKPETPPVINKDNLTIPSFMLRPRDKESLH